MPAQPQNSTSAAATAAMINTFLLPAGLAGGPLGGGTGTSSTSMSMPGCVIGWTFLIVPGRGAGTGVSRGAAGTGVASTGSDDDDLRGETAGADAAFTGAAPRTAGVPS